MSERRTRRVSRHPPPKSGAVTEDDVRVEPDCISVWVASGTEELRRNLIEHLAQEPGITVRGSSGDNYACLAAYLEHHRPDLLLLDGRRFTPVDTGHLDAIRNYANAGRVVLLLDRADKRTTEDILRNGFHGYLLTTEAVDNCAAAIRAVSRGEIWIPRAVLANVLGSWLKGGRAPSRRVGLHGVDTRSLTARERQILTQLKKGLSNKQIAAEIGVLEDTVKKHLQHVYNKLGVRRRTIVLAREARL